METERDGGDEDWGGGISCKYEEYEEVKQEVLEGTAGMSVVVGDEHGRGAMETEGATEVEMAEREA